jgi:hypothetical protein
MYPFRGHMADLQTQKFHASAKNILQSFKKSVTELNKEFSSEEYQMAEKHLKKYFKCLVEQKMDTKPCKSLNLAPRRQRQMDLYGLEATLLYLASYPGSRPPRTRAVCAITCKYT